MSVSECHWHEWLIGVVVFGIHNVYVGRYRSICAIDRSLRDQLILIDLSIAQRDGQGIKVGDRKHMRVDNV